MRTQGNGSLNPAAGIVLKRAEVADATLVENCCHSVDVQILTQNVVESVTNRAANLVEVLSLHAGGCEGHEERVTGGEAHPDIL